MRKIAKQRGEEGAEIDLTPMLDVVFIMLIFFIVVASFLKEAGLEINRPDDNQPQDPNDSISIVVEISSDNQLWMENRRVDVRAVRANIQRLLAEDPEAPVTIKVAKELQRESLLMSPMRRERQVNTTLVGPLTRVNL